MMCTIVLIHGTWAPNAPWTRPSSPFRTMLIDQLSSREVSDVHFERFDWSGRNSHLDRRRASIRLRKLVRQIHTRSDAPVFLIGHSHGGNIALKVARSGQGTSPVSGVVAMATPFLEFTESEPRVARVASALIHGARSSVRVALGWMFLGAISLLMSPLTVLVLKLKLWLWAPVWGGPRQPTMLELVVVPVIACGYALATFAMAFQEGREVAVTVGASRHRRMQRAVARYFYVQPARELASVPVFSLSAPLDEALQSLNGAWWAHRSVMWAARGAIGAAFLSLGAAAAASAAAAGFIMAEMAYRPEFVRTGILLFCGIGAVIVPAGFLLASAFARLLTAFASLPAPLLALEGGQRRVVWSVRAARRLAARPQYCHKSYRLSELTGLGVGLLHSSLYKSPLAVHDVAAWIADNMKRPNGIADAAATASPAAGRHDWRARPPWPQSDR